MNKTIKKLLSVMLAVLMVFPSAGIFAEFSLLTQTAQASAEGQSKTDFGLRFNNGKFKVMQIADIQDAFYNLPAEDDINFTPIFEAIKKAVRIFQPNLIVLTGDNFYIYNDNRTSDAVATFKATVDKLVSAFNGTPFAVTFGNHDSEKTYGRQAQYDYWVSKGALDFDNNFYNGELVGVGTGCVPIRSADGSNVAWNIAILDSGTYDNRSSKSGKYYGKPGLNPGKINGTGAEALDDPTSTTANQNYMNVVNWFKSMNESLKSYTANKDYAPTLAFQHMALQEVYTGGIINEVNSSYPDAIVSTNRATEFNGRYYFPNYDNPTVAGVLGESPSGSDSSTKELYKAFAEKGNVKGIFYGHDHQNTVVGEGTVNYDGVDYTLVQGFTPGLTFRERELTANDHYYVPNSKATSSAPQGAKYFRFFDLNETDGSYTTHVTDVTELEEGVYAEDLTTVTASNKNGMMPGGFGKYICELGAVYDRSNISSAKSYLRSESRDRAKTTHYKNIVYSTLECDLNDGAGAKDNINGKTDSTVPAHVILGYKKTDDVSKAITDIKLYKTSSSTVPSNTQTFGGITYNLVVTGEDTRLDLNKHPGSHKGSYIYTYYTTDTRAGAPITSLYAYSVNQAKSDYLSDQYPYAATWSDSAEAANLNNGIADSSYVYLRFARDTTPRYVGELATATSSTSFDKAKRSLLSVGYHVLNQDLNKGIYGATHIALGYKLTVDAAKAIRGICFTQGSMGDSFRGTYNGMPCTWHIVDKGNAPKVNFNQGASGTAIYCYYTTDASVSQKTNSTDPDKSVLKGQLVEPKLGAPIVALYSDFFYSKSQYSDIANANTAWLTENRNYVCWNESETPANLNEGNTVNDDGNRAYEIRLSYDVDVSQVGNVRYESKKLATLNKDGGQGGDNSVFLYKAPYTLKITLPVKQGYTFVGYYFKDTKIIDAAGIQIADIPDDFTGALTAHWEIEQSVEPSCSTGHTDANGDGICDFCNSTIDSNDGCTCHKGNIFSWIVRFIYSFYSKLTGRTIKCCPDMKYMF